MPIISPIGRRSPKVRAVYVTIFAVLIVGAVTMVYPLLLMISGSFRSEVDSQGLSVIPAYWSDDSVLYQKYLEARYSNILFADLNHEISYRSWRRMAPADQLPEELKVDSLPPGWVQAYRSYRDQAQWPTAWYAVAQSQAGTYYRFHARKYRKLLYHRFKGNIKALNDSYDTGYVGWEAISLPPIAVEQLYSRRSRTAIAWGHRDIRSVFQQYKSTVPKRDRIPVNVDGSFVHNYLLTIYPTIDIYNQTHGTDYPDYRSVLLSSHRPPGGQVLEDWENYVRVELNLNFIRLDRLLAPKYRDYMATCGEYDDIAAYNDRHQTAFTGFEQLPFPISAPDTLAAQEDMSSFVADRQACPVDKIEVYGPRQDLLAYLQKTDQQIPDASSLPLPIAEIDFLDFEDNKAAVRWEEIRRNYIHIIEYVLLHGHAVRNTVIYCSLMILTTLLVNPLAAYALSRYRPPSQYKVLLICMATMAFPGEVTMIPAFLLLKKFPFWNLLTGVAASAAVLWVGFKMYPKVSEAIIGLTATAAGVLAGWWLAPYVASGFGYDSTHISLLNTFKALVLPAMANGYGLFLLKGFFDSLPRELYESADIDGAGEWTKFWSLTMALSKPILAVLALGAFTAAYSEFMMALIIIPDRAMWTLMVFLYQLQLRAPQAVIHTSVIIAAIPTFIVFIFCQNIIIRGIVVPVEK